MTRRFLLCSGLLLLSVDAFAITSGPIANPYRAYPVSCLSYPLQEIPSGPIFSATITVPAVNASNGQESLSEPVQLQIWRVACADGKSALMGEIDRNSDNDGKTSQIPVYPSFNITQGSTLFAGVRTAMEPNTFIANVVDGTQLQYGIQFVFENFIPDGNAPVIDYSKAMTIQVVPGLGLSTTTAAIATYDPSLYSTASQPLPISGYLSGAWYDPAHGGEGMLIQVYANADGITRTFYAQWFTYSPSGQPFWLVAQGNVNIGDRQLTGATTQYLTGGGFAGAVKANNRQTWGTMSFAFSDCNTLQFSYSGQTDAATAGPSGTGSRTWTRLGNVNGAVCD